MIALFTPTRDTVTAGFAFDLAQLIRHDPETLFAISQGTYLNNLRTLAARAAIDRGMTHLLFIDSDMRFPPDTAIRLRARDRAIVGANCRQRTQQEWTARRDGRFVSSTGRSGLDTVDTLGMGVTLIATEVFNRLEAPWFDQPYDSGTGKHIGEDVSFCLKARAAGFTIHIDHDLSQQIRHAGLVEF